MAQFFYDLTQSPYFGVLLILWTAIDVLWISRWKALFARIGLIISKPWIFVEDKNSGEPPLYPREFLEQLAKGSSTGTKGGSRPEGGLSRWIKAQSALIFEEDHPLRTIGYLMFLAFFIFFLIADAISVAQTLQVMGLIEEQLPALFQRFDLAVLGGALLAAVVSIWVFAEALGVSEFIDTGRLNDAQRSFLKGLSLIVAVNSIIVMIAFAMNRLIAIGNLETNDTMNIVLNAILFGLVPINSALAAAICFPAATRGLLVVIYLLVYLFVGILPVLAFLLDVVWRICYVLVDVVLWALFTPFILIPVGIGKILGMLNPQPKAPPKK